MQVWPGGDWEGLDMNAQVSVDDIYLEVGKLVMTVKAWKQIADRQEQQIELLTKRVAELEAQPPAEDGGESSPTM